MHSWGSKIAIILFLADVHIQAYGSTAGLLEPSWVARNLKCFGIRDLDDRWKIPRDQYQKTFHACIVSYRDGFLILQETSILSLSHLVSNRLSLRSDNLWFPIVGHKRPQNYPLDSWGNHQETGALNHTYMAGQNFDARCMWALCFPTLLLTTCTSSWCMAHGLFIFGVSSIRMICYLHVSASWTAIRCPPF